MKFDKEIWTACLTEAVTNTMEAMTFTAVDPAETPPPAGLVCRIPVQEPFVGELQLALPWELAQELATAAFGTEPDDPVLVQDALGEILNTIAGQFLCLLVKGEQDFRLGLPENGQASAQPADLTLTLCANGTPFSLQLVLTAAP